VNAAAPLSLALITRYDQAGPRYTSYPTAPHLSSAFGEAEFRHFAIAGSETDKVKPLSLYVHVPFCTSPCFYCGCNRVITRSPERGVAYVSRLLREIDCVGSLFPNREVAQLHFGGGTPNFLTPSQLGAIVAALRSRFTCSDRADRELSIEIDPRFLHDGEMAQLAAIGFNRVSLGVQDFDSDVQSAVNRNQTIEQTVGAIGDCRCAGIHSLNVDLMYGLPRQSLDRFDRTLQLLIDARPSRIAIYGYAHMPQLFQAQRRIRAEDLPDAATRVALLGVAIEVLTAAGYRYIGMDHFALPDDDLVRAQERGTLHRNFMGYSTHGGCDLLGLGVSAISHIGNSLSQNPRDLADWEAAIDAGRLPVWRGLALDADDVIRADVIDRIMCQGEVDIAAVERQHEIDFWTYFAVERAQLTKLEADGLAWACSSRVMATPQGRYMLRAIARCFDRYLQSVPVPSSGGFSKLI
jgi:oxygen-independent coproporphyrinogen III oxidase